MGVKPHSQELHDMCLAHFNEPMLSFDELVRCIGYGETGVDCYIITRCQRGNIRWNTCVGGYTWLNRLKGQNYVRSTTGEDWDDLYRLDGDLERMGCPKEPAFITDYRHDDMEDANVFRTGAALSEGDAS